MSDDTSSVAPLSSAASSSSGAASPGVSAFVSNNTAQQNVKSYGLFQNPKVTCKYIPDACPRVPKGTTTTGVTCWGTVTKTSATPYASDFVTRMLSTTSTFHTSGCAADGQSDEAHFLEAKAFAENTLSTSLSKR